MVTADLIRLSLSSTPKISFPRTRSSTLRTSLYNPLLIRPSLSFRPKSPSKTLKTPRAKAVEIGISTKKSQEQKQQESNSVLIDVGGMMCGACSARVKAILSSDGRVESTAVNILTETAAVRLKSAAVEAEASGAVADDLVRRLTECGFPSKRRESGMGIGENLRKWKEMAERKAMLMARSRNRVAFAWTLVALCCGSHASHLLHSVGIHVAHGMVLVEKNAMLALNYSRLKILVLEGVSACLENDTYRPLYIRKNI